MQQNTKNRNKVQTKQKNKAQHYKNIVKQNQNHKNKHEKTTNADPTFAAFSIMSLILDIITNVVVKNLRKAKVHQVR